MRLPSRLGRYGGDRRSRLEAGNELTAYDVTYWLDAAGRLVEALAAETGFLAYCGVFALIVLLAYLMVVLTADGQRGRR